MARWKFSMPAESATSKFPDKYARRPHIYIHTYTRAGYRSVSDRSRGTSTCACVARVYTYKHWLVNFDAAGISVSVPLRCFKDCWVLRPDHTKIKVLKICGIGWYGTGMEECTYSFLCHDECSVCTENEDEEKVD